MLVFVYGTLLEGECRSSVLGQSTLIGPGLTHGRLFDCGAHPGMVEGKGDVVGEVYEVTASTLDTLDCIEGYFESAVATSLFVRKRVRVRLFADGSLVDAFAYVINRSSDGLTGIEHGDYRRYLMERRAGTVWVAAYGSNLDTEHLCERVGGCPERLTGAIPGFRLEFNKKAMNGVAAYANIKFVGETDPCPAVAYKLHYVQLDKLDANEGCPAHYMRICVPFDHESGRRIVQAYIAHPDMLVQDRKPSEQYLVHIRKGYEIHQLDQEHLAQAVGRIK